jgi:hypothetical protein
MRNNAKFLQPKVAIFTILAMVLPLILSKGAVASASAADDPRDAVGSPFDVDTIGSNLQHIQGKNHFIFGVRMVTRWRAARPNDPGARILFHIDSRGGKHSDLFIRLFEQGGTQVSATLFRRDPRRVFARWGCAKSGARVSCTLGRSGLHPNKRVRWFVTTMHDGIADRAPDEGALLVTRI